MSSVKKLKKYIVVVSVGVKTEIQKTLISVDENNERE